MEIVRSAPKARASSRNSPGLPHQPRKRSEFTPSTRLTTNGARIAHGTPPTTGRPGRSSAEPCGESDAEEHRLRTEVSTPSAASQRGDDEVSTRRTGLSPRPDVVQELPVDAMELARGGEVLLRRLAEVGSANADLRRQLEHQSKEVSTLEDVGRQQQHLLIEFERQATEKRRAEAHAAESRAQQEAEAAERKLRAEVEILRQQSKDDQASIVQELQESKGIVLQREGERDEARAMLADLSARLEVALAAPEANSEKLKGAQMELRLAHERIMREETSRKVAEQAERDATERSKQLEADLMKAHAHIRKLEQQLSEQTEVSAFRQELCRDLQAQMQQQQADADAKLRREKAKVQTVARLEGILPKHMIVQALEP